MSSKLVRKKKSNVERSWMWNEIEKQGKVNEWKRYFASYCVPMMINSQEICLWILHAKFGFGRKRLERVQACVNAYMESDCDGDLNTRQLPEALRVMKTSCDVYGEAKKVPQRMRIKMSKMERVNNQMEFRIRVKVVTDALAMTYAMICTELVTMEKMSGAKIREFLSECTAFINDYLDGGWVCQEDIRYQLEKETGVKVVLQ